MSQGRCVHAFVWHPCVCTCAPTSVTQKEVFVSRKGGLRRCQRVATLSETQPDHAPRDQGPGQPKMGPKRWSGAQNSGLGVRLGHSEGCKEPKVGGCTQERCPDNCNLRHIAQDMAESWFLAIMNLNGVWGWQQGSTARHDPQNAPSGFPSPKTFYLHVICHLKCIGHAGNRPHGSLAPF